MPLPDNIPATPFQFIEIITTGLVASAGSSSKLSQQVYQYRRTSTVGAFSKTNIDTAFQAAVVVPCYALLNERLTQQNNTVRVINDVFDAPVSFSHAVQGSITGDSEPLSVSSFIEGKTGLRGKRNRGSKKLFPMSESDTTAASADLWNAGCLARLATYAAAWLAGFTDGNGNVWVPCIISRKYSQLTVNPIQLWWNLLTQTAVRKTQGSMRHRKVKSVY